MRGAAAELQRAWRYARVRALRKPGAQRRRLILEYAVAGRYAVRLLLELFRLTPMHELTGIALPLDHVAGVLQRAWRAKRARRVPSGPALPRKKASSARQARVRKARVSGVRVPLTRAQQLARAKGLAPVSEEQ
eukprot:4184736-Prymnesium_polylepis.1